MVLCTGHRFSILPYGIGQFHCHSADCRSYRVSVLPSIGSSASLPWNIHLPSPLRLHPGKPHHGCKSPAAYKMSSMMKKAPSVLIPVHHIDTGMNSCTNQLHRTPEVLISVRALLIKRQLAGYQKYRNLHLR